MFKGKFTFKVKMKFKVKSVKSIQSMAKFVQENKISWWTFYRNQIKTKY